MNIILNGEIHALNSTMNLNDFLHSLNLPQQAMAIAVNRTVIGRENWASYHIQDQDQIDIVRAVGGG